MKRPKRPNFDLPRPNVAICSFDAFSIGQRSIAIALRNASKAPEDAFGIVTPLLNRTGPDGAFQFPPDNWYLIAPIGDHPNTDSGFVQRVDQTSVEAMANSFKPGQELLVDFDHESWNTNKRTTAA